jgi:hypothetical protein
VARLCGLGYEEDDILYEMEEGAIEFLNLDREILGNMMLEVLEAVEANRPGAQIVRLFPYPSIPIQKNGC